MGEPTGTHPRHNAIVLAVAAVGILVLITLAVIASTNEPEFGTPLAPADIFSGKSLSTRAKGAAEAPAPAQDADQEAGALPGVTPERSPQASDKTGTGRPALEDDAATETGKAAWYDLDSKTATGETMDAEAMTAAHPTLPLGTRVRVENLKNGRAVVVRINDRGPYGGGRIIDVSKAAAARLGMIEDGVVKVRVSLVAGPAGALKTTTR